LSALDPEVGKQLFDDCIVGLMKGKTRLFVTNQIQFLEDCDKIIALGKRRVLEQGTFEELTLREGGELRRILDDDKSSKGDRKSQTVAHTATASESKAARSPEKVVTAAGPEKKKDTLVLLTKEERNVGAVAWTVYKNYMIAGGGLLKFGVVYSSFCLCAANTLASTGKSVPADLQEIC
jgi:ATP-binding cassette subfamily C (CFTR/MRP) protein 1